ncbi:class II aldolase/adducin N-terminal [Blastocladiella britannica]|nr:class II aldolase/adducin N-terminal [Blastocladiella britannica]
MAKKKKNSNGNLTTTSVATPTTGASVVETTTTTTTTNGSTNAIDDSYAPREESEAAEQLIPALCKQFYTLGWVSGTGGGMSIREKDRVYIAPSGVQKERLQPSDMFVLDRTTRAVVVHPTSARGAALKQSACTPLFFNAYELRNAGACIHTHSQAAVMITLLTKGSVFEVTHQEMIKGIRRGSSSTNFRYYERLRIPIIENTPEEEDLQGRMEQAMLAFPETNAVLVRRHGVYVWGESWEKAKSMAECYDYLFELAVKMIQAGLDPAAVPEDEEYDNDGKRADSPVIAAVPAATKRKRSAVDSPSSSSAPGTLNPAKPKRARK